jgi:uncharacterized protein
MRIVISGGTGFIGEAVARALGASHDVAVLTRNPAHVRAGRGVAWSPPQQDAWVGEIAEADVVINLAGENIGQRWTDERKRSILTSRLDATHALVNALRAAPPKPRAFLSASAVGYYGNRGDEVLDESAPRGGGFLADVVEQWEHAAREAEPYARLVVMRFGVVLDTGGGALDRLLPPFRLGAGGPVGNGRQWMSWVARADVVRFIEWAATHDSVRGVYNVTAPAPVRNRDFTRALGRALRRPAFVPVPAFALRVMFGEMADETLLAGQRVVPAHAVAQGFVFRFSTVDSALADIL